MMFITTTTTTSLTILFSSACLLAESKPLLTPDHATTPTRRQATTTPSPPPGLYSWQATDFTFGCGSAACGVGFNISAPAAYISASAPAFDVQCGALYGSGWNDCTPNDSDSSGAESESRVQVRWDTANGTAPPYRVVVAHTWVETGTGAVWNATGAGSSSGGDGEGGDAFVVRGVWVVGEVRS